MLGSRPRQDADPFYAVVLLRKSSDRRYHRRAAWKRDELAPLHFTARIGNGCSLAQFGAEIARLAFPEKCHEETWAVATSQKGERAAKAASRVPINAFHSLIGNETSAGR